MKCGDMRRDISRQLDGELERSRAEELERHLEACESCRSFQAEMLSIYSLHEGLAESDAPSTLLPGVMSTLEETRQRSRARWWYRLALPAAAALVMFLGVLAGGRIAEMVGPADGNGQADVFGLEYLEEMPPGSIGELMLADSEGSESDER
jgi:anti-sigma factor RsiW